MTKGMSISSGMSNATPVRPGNKQPDLPPDFKIHLGR